MRRLSRLCSRGGVVVALSALVGPAWAFDLPAPGDGSSWRGDDTIAAFRAATRAYYAGDKQGAVDGLRFAADKGHPAAQWKLGQMYADGDGVREDDATAFEYFSKVIADHADDAPDSADAPFVADAFVEIGSYYLTGISNSSVAVDTDRARELFTYAASYFGDSDAQLALGRMMHDGVGGEVDPQQAARWFMLAAKKGNIDAQAELGRLLATGEGVATDRVHGLMWLTVALRRAQAEGHPDATIRAAHESAFGLASEDERRAALQLADQWLAGRPVPAALAAGQ